MDPSEFFHQLAASITDDETRRVAEFMTNHVGEKNSITLEQLCRFVFGAYNDAIDRKARKILEDLVTNHHMPIGAYSGKSGRWLCADEGEVEKVALDLKARVDALSDRIRNLKTAKVPPKVPEFTKVKQVSLW